MALAFLAFFVEMWTVVPAPTVAPLVLAVAVPEMAPIAAVVCALVLGFAIRWTRGGARLAGAVAASLALACALVPILELPGTIVAADGALRAAGITERDGAAPFDAVVLLRGDAPVAGVAVRSDLPVIARDGSRLAFDLYRPAGSGTHPTLVLLYGGAWHFGSRRDSATLARTYAGLGYTVAAIEYRLAPSHRFPTQLDDVRAALATLARNAAAWGVDPNRVALFGRSAGAELALLAAYEPGPLRIRAVVAYYAPIDLADGYAHPPNPDPVDVRAILRAYLGGTPSEMPAAYRAASPLAHVRPGLPSTLLAIGLRDELVVPAFQRTMRDALAAHAVPVVAIELPWSNHAFDSIGRGLGGQLARSVTERFLAAELARRAEAAASRR